MHSPNTFKFRVPIPLIPVESIIYSYLEEEMTTQTIVDTEYYLIIAVYDHDEFLKLDQTEENSAKWHARNCFGYRVRDINTKDVIDRVPNHFISEDFFYLGYFPYHTISSDDKTHSARGEYLYGWTAILKGTKLNQILSNSAFLRIFKFEVLTLNQIQINNLTGFISNHQPDPLEKSPTLWETRGLDVYDDQTPRMWTPG
ncbi:MAG: hypothetical protein Fur0022_08740 [Anaerolineales bacterium]